MVSYDSAMSRAIVRPVSRILLSVGVEQFAVPALVESFYEVDSMGFGTDAIFHPTFPSLFGMISDHFSTKSSSAVADATDRRPR